MSENVQNCFIDYLAFTIRGFEGVSIEDQWEYALSFVNSIFGPLPVETSCKGWRGYDYSFKVGGGIVAFGGEANNNTMHFSFPGEMCGLVADWNKLAAYLDEPDRIKLTRVDIAHDDVEGETLSIEWAREQYQTGGFKPQRGMSPNARFLSDEGSGSGCTYYVGSRESGKMCRIYEKGKQLGDMFSRWVRFEVEWLSTHRELNVNMLRDPSSYLAASYPAAGFVSSRLSVVKTLAFKAAATLEKGIEHVKKQGGGVIKAMLDLGEDAYSIIAQLCKPEVSPRLVASVEALKRIRKEQKPIVVPAWYRAPTHEQTRETENRLRVDLDYWRSRWSKFQPENMGIAS